MAHPLGHQERVDAWLAHAGAGASASQLVDLLARAVDAIWRRAQQTLGDLTVRAIATRVLQHAVGRHAILGSLQAGAEGVSFDALRRAVAAHEIDVSPGGHARLGHDPRGGAPTIDEGRLRAAIRDLVVELLTVFGDMTANILTPPLHEALERVADPASVRASGGEAPVDRADEDRREPTRDERTDTERGARGGDTT